MTISPVVAPVLVSLFIATVFVSYLLILIKNKVGWFLLVFVSLPLFIGFCLSYEQRDARNSTVYLTKSDDKHFYANAVIGGVPVRFMVDTGATHVSLSPDDARRLGHDLDQLNYSSPHNTANGTVYLAPTRIQSISIGPITMYDVKGTIHRDGLKTSLLGMSFLNRLSGFEKTGNRLVFRP